MPETVKEAGKTKLLEKCSQCGKQIGLLTDAPITGWIFGSSRCMCSEQGDSVSNTESVTDDTDTSSEKANVESPLLSERFEVLDFLGEGGMGQVFKVHDRETDATLALKCLSRKLAADKEAVKRFHQELSTVSNLNHPHIISVYGHTETTDHRPCLMMDYISGGSLKNLLARKKKLNQSEAIDIFVQIAEALKYAHGNGLLHRDLKPSNIMLSTSESGVVTARLVDFGIAKVMPATSGDRDTQDLTKTGEVFGSPAYMSPEQCMGFKLDERSDIYSFGCLMYETIVGHPPFDAANPIEVVVKQLSASPGSWSNTKEGKPLKGIEAIVFKCLSKESDERYQSVELLLKDLNQLKSGKKVSEFNRRDSTKAFVSVGQAGMLVFEALALVTYWTVISMPILGILSVIPAVLLPLFGYQLIRHIKQFGLAGSNWKQWRLLSLIAYTLLSITAIPVFLGTFGETATLFENHQNIFAISLLFHLTLVPISFATRIGAYFFTGAQKQFKTVGFQFACVVVPLLIFVFTSLGPGFSYFMPHIPAKLLGGHKFSMTWRPEQAIALGRVATTLDPNYVEGYEILARNLIADNKYKEALTVLDSVMGKDLKFEKRSILELRADAYLALGQPDKALKALDSAIASEKDDKYSSQYFLGSLFRRRGQIKLELHDYKSAAADFREAETIYPDRYSSDTEDLAIAQWRSGEVKQAIAGFTNEIENRARSESKSLSEYALLNPEDFVQRAIVYESNNDLESARKDYLAATQGDPQAPLDEQAKKFEVQVAKLKEVVPWWITLTKPVSEKEITKKENERLSYVRLARAYAFSRLKNEKQFRAELAKAEKLGGKKSELLKDFAKRANLKLDW